MTLVTIAPGKQLEATAAASYARMRAAGMPAGGITSAWRSSTEQAALRARYLSNPARWPFAQPPGKSKHEAGIALDLAPAPEAWVRAHPEHGWRFTDPKERWHAEHFPLLDVASRTTAPPPVAPAPAAPTPTLEDEDMPTVVHAGTAGSYLLDGGVLLPLDPAALAEAQRVGFKAIGIGRDLYLQWARAGHPEAVMIRDAGSGSIALAVGGSPFEPVPDMTTYADLLAQGVPVRSVTAAMYAALTTKEQS